ncbi:SPOSA6832_00353, partial [Sporobolomyces salmonicolor]
MIAFTYPGIERDFHVGREVATLSLSLFVLSMGVVPIIIAPLSEWFGRSPVYFVGFALYIAFNGQVAGANNIATLLLGRFFAGAGGAGFLSVAGGTVADLFRPHEVGAPMGFYTAGPFLGPVFGPVISGFINQHCDWRVTWSVFFVAMLLLVPETYLPAVLKKKAKKLRKAGRTDVRAPNELDQRSIVKVIGISCIKPFELLAREPMALVLCIWTALLLGILYMFFSAFAIVYEAHGFTSLSETQYVGLSYLGLGIGIIFGALCHPIWAGFYRRKREELGRRPPPEEHLRKGLYGVVICPAALFWFAWTTQPSIHWIVSMLWIHGDEIRRASPDDILIQLATVPFGVGLLWSFQAVFLYLVDAFRPVAASAMAANSAMRSSFAGGALPSVPGSAGTLADACHRSIVVARNMLTLFAIQMFHRLGTQWALTLCAFLCLAMVPWPFLFYKMGHKYRKGSKFANTED